MKNMKTIKVLLAPRDQDRYEFIEWQNSISLDDIQHSQKFLQLVNVLLINFWQSVVANADKMKFLEYGCPEISVKKNKDGFVLTWSILTVQEKRS